MGLNISGSIDRVRHPEQYPEKNQKDQLLIRYDINRIDRFIL